MAFSDLDFKHAWLSAEPLVRLYSSDTMPLRGSKFPDDMVSTHGDRKLSHGNGAFTVHSVSVRPGVLQPHGCHMQTV